MSELEVENEVKKLLPKNFCISTLFHHRVVLIEKMSGQAGDTFSSMKQVVSTSLCRVLQYVF